MKKTLWLLRASAVLLGFCIFWLSRYDMYSDGISYLDIADAYLHGPWKSAVSIYWSPAFSWLLAAGIALLHPAPRFEAEVVHGFVFASYIAAIAAFECFLHCVLDLWAWVFPESELTPAMRRKWFVTAYWLLLWSTLWLIGLRTCTPDMSVAALGFIVVAMLARAARGPVRLRFCALFGALLGLGFLFKAALLPVGIPTLAGFIVLVARFSKPWKSFLLSLASLLAVSLPYLAAMRMATGSWTLGSTGTLNYAWEVDDIPRYIHWQGGPEAGYGSPRHSTRQLMHSPAVYEFSTPLPGTYPPWFDPSYWSEGLRARFLPLRQLRAWCINTFFVLVLTCLAPGILHALVLYFHDRPTVPWIRWLYATAGIWCWCGATFLIYSLVFIEPRYIGGVLASGLSVVLLPLLAAWQRVTVLRHRSFSALSLILGFCWLCVPAFLGLAMLVFNATGMQPLPNRHWLKAEQMRALGVGRGDRIAYIGFGMHAYWPRLLRTRIVAEVPILYGKKLNLSRGLKYDLTEVNAFWRATPERQNQVLAAFARAGARWVVAEPVPAGVTPGPEWTEMIPTPGGDEAWGKVTRAYARYIDFR